MDRDNNKKVILRFRFIVIFSILLLLAVFIVYVIGTSIEEVYEREGMETNKPVATETTTVTASDQEETKPAQTTLNDLAVPDTTTTATTTTTVTTAA